MKGWPRAVLWPERGGVSGAANYAIKLALLPVGRAWRRRLRGQVTFVGITGSSGKTTAKRLTWAVLSDVGATRALVRGNRARKLLRTLLTTTRAHRFCVVELGAFGPGTLDELLWPYEPGVAVLTTAGWDHRSAFGGPDGAALEKGKVVEALPPDGIAILNADDARVRAMADRAPGRRIVLYGIAEAAEVRAEDVGPDDAGFLRFTLITAAGRTPVTTQLTGTHWLVSVLAALATGIALGVEPRAAAAAVARTTAHPHRLSRLAGPGGVTILRDDWKASVPTVAPALEALSGVPARRRIVVLGQLSDDPRGPRKLYAAIARQAREHAELVVLVGRWAQHGLRARASAADPSVQAFATGEEAAAYLRPLLRAGDVVLLKGTHGQASFEALAPLLAGAPARA